MAKINSSPLVEIGADFSRPDRPDVVFAPIYCSDHYFTGPWPCNCKPGPQYSALISNADEVSMGGARGGSKTATLLAWMVKGNVGLRKFKWGAKLQGADATYVAHKNYRGLVLIEQANDLGYLLDRAEEMYKALPIKEITRDNPAEARFLSGAKIIFGYFGEDGWKKYLGPEFQRIGFDQLEKMPKRETYDRILGSKRSRYHDLIPQAFSTWNPGGGEDLKGAPGQSWIMDYFRVDDYINGVIPYGVPVRDKEGKTTLFLPSRVYDNPFYRWKWDILPGQGMVQVMDWKCKVCGHVTRQAGKPKACSNPKCSCYAEV